MQQQVIQSKPLQQKVNEDRYVERRLSLSLYQKRGKYKSSLNATCLAGLVISKL